MLEKDSVEHIARLARIGITEEEASLYQKELSSVLDFFSELEKLETGDIEPVGHASGRMALARTDALDESSLEEREALLANVPEKKGSSVSVRSVL